MLKWLLNKIKSPTPVRGYTIREQIFEGAFSDIYRAYSRDHDEEVALKVLTPAGEKIAGLLDGHENAVWEGELLKSLQHPNIIEYIDSGKGTPYWIAMEFLESDIKPYVGPCRDEAEENEIIELINQVVAALSYLHGRGFVHRDICLGNILVGSDGTAKLIDFGMSVPSGCKLVKGRVGTPSYMAPEMIKTSHYTPSADMYSLGIVMYELVTGKRPFKGKMKQQRMTRSLNVDPHPPSHEGGYCSQELENLIMRCISKDAEKRPSEARELAQSLFILRRRRGLT